MKILAVYDVVNNKIRKKVVTFLQENGFVRVQNSVFLANYKKEEVLKLNKVEKLINQNEDKINFFLISDDEYKKSIYLIKKQTKDVLDNYCVFI